MPAVPSPLYFAERLTKKLGGAKIYFKRDELNHTGSHKINNVLGQVLMAKRMGKTRVIAETGAGQHGVATATACALFDIPCVVFMGAIDVDRQAPNVVRMNMLGAEVRAVKAGSATLKDAMNEALRDWVATCENTFYCIGTVAGPHPYPAMVRDFQCVIGNETRVQMMKAEGRLPDTLVACIGGGSNAMGLFHPFLDDKGVRIVGVEAGGKGVETGEHAASLTGGRPGVLHGNRTYLLQDMAKARSPRRTRSRLVSITRASDPSIPGSRKSAASNTCRRPTAKRSRRSSCCASSRASSPRSNPRMPWRTSPSSRPRCPRTICW